MTQNNNNTPENKLPHNERPENDLSREEPVPPRRRAPRVFHPIPSSTAPTQTVDRQAQQQAAALTWHNPQAPGKAPHSAPLSAAQPEPAPAPKPEPESEPEWPPAAKTGPVGLKQITSVYHGFRWGAVFFAALTGLITLAIGMWFTHFITQLFAAQGLLGWLAVGLLSLLILAALVITAREILTLMRLRHLETIRRDAESALNHDDSTKAKQSCDQLKTLLADKKALAWSIDELHAHESEIMSARERLALAERSLLVPLDAEARSLIAQTAQRVSVVTAISPMAVLDVVYVGAENLRLIRHIALIYGGHPGFWGLLRLARMVFANLVIAGALSLGEDVIQQLLGQKLGAKLSARLGEGILNGALTARIGLAAVNTIRPLPFIEAEPARFRDFMKELAQNWAQKITGKG